MPIDAARALAADPRPGEIGWDHKDIQLYHLGLGAGLPATDPDELRYTLESRLHVLPSFATVAGASMAMLGGLGQPGIEVDLANVLHGGHSIELHRPIPVKGRATSSSRVAAVYDKGKAAVVVLRSEVADADGPLWTSDAQIFIRGEGGFGGERGPSVREELPERAPTGSRSAASARNRPCCTASPATGTRCTPTPSSPSWPASSSRSCTACARTA